MDLKKSLLKVFGANFIALIVGIVNGFFLPAFLDIDQYAFLKTYTLYISYVGILHFGFLDGIYLKYGGKYKNSLNKKELKYEHNYLFLFQLLLTSLILIFGFIRKDFIIIAFALSIIPINMRTYFSFLYQSLGEMGTFAKIKSAFPITILSLNLIFIFVVKINDYLPFVLANLISHYLVFFIFEMNYRKDFKSKDIKKVEVKPLFLSGFFIMMGNLSNMFFYSIDRWFVKFLLPIENFAFYSFAISMMNIIIMMINSVAMTFYPYFSRGYEILQIKKIKQYLIIIGAFASSGYFILSIIVNNFLDKYIQSLEVIAILFVSFPAMAVINALYVNLFKVNKRERKYFSKVLRMLIISIVFNTIAVFISLSNFSIAIATSLAFYFWFFSSSKDFEGLETNLKEILFIIFYIPLFLISSNYMNYIYGFVSFLIGIFILTFLIYRKEFKELIYKIMKKPSE
jgi:O-antigen/teichoic acid export membrane protein